MFRGKNWNDILERNREAEEVLEKIDFTSLKVSPECLILFN